MNREHKNRALIIIVVFIVYKNYLTFLSFFFLSFLYWSVMYAHKDHSNNNIEIIVQQ